MNTKNGILAVSLLSAMTLTSVTSIIAMDQKEPMAISQVTKEETNNGEITNYGKDVANDWTYLRYLDNGTDPAEGTQAKDKWGQYTGWTRPWKDGDNANLNGYFNDNAWPYQLGAFSTDGSEGNRLNKNSNAYFFRGRFEIKNKNDIYGLRLNFDYKDAVIVYINGQQLTSLNVPDEGYRTTGEGTGSHKDNLGFGSKETFTTKQSADLYFRDIKDMLLNGENIISFEVHKTNADSSAYLKLNHLAINPDERLLPARAPLKAISLSVGSKASELNLNWFATDENAGKVQFAKKSEMIGNEFPVAQATTVNAQASKAQAAGYYANKATMSGLAENTEYVYRLGNDNNWSDVYTTTTKDSGDFSFLFAGDPQLGSSGDLTADKDGWKNTLDLIKTNPLFKDVDFIQNAGDHVEAGKNESQYDAYLANYKDSTVYSTPFANAVGNHDYEGTAYNDHFNLPNVSDLGSSGEGNAQGDYYYVYNNTLMLVLNSNNRSSAEHQEFIRSAMEKTQDQDIRWKIVVFHHSVYSTASHANDGDILDRRSGLVPVFKKAGIDLVLMGHDHIYTRSMLMDGLEPLKDQSFDELGNPISEVTDPQGITYITANSASGSKFYEFNDTLTGDYVAVKNQEHIANVSKLDISDNQLKIITYRTNDLSVVDEFAINKTPVAGDKTALATIIEKAKGYQADKYTAETYSALTNAISAGQAVLDDQTASQDAIDQAINEIQVSIDGLVEKTVTPGEDQKPGQSGTNDQKPSATVKPTTSKPGVKTGDDTAIIAYLAATGIVSLAGASAYIKLKRKEN